jgi:hypothetical protein
VAQKSRTIVLNSNYLRPIIQQASYRNLLPEIICLDFGSFLLTVKTLFVKKKLHAFDFFEQNNQSSSEAANLLVLLTKRETAGRIRSSQRTNERCHLL